MRYLKTFIFSAPILGLLYHWMSLSGPDPLPWWPDTVIVGGLTGMLAAFILMRVTHAQNVARHLGRMTGILWRRGK